MFFDAIGEGIVLGIEANKKHEPVIATRWADFGWEMLEVVKGIGEGVVFGAYNTSCFAKNIVCHPVQIACEFGLAIGTVGCCLGKAIGVSVNLGSLCIAGNTKEAYKEVQKIYEQVMFLLQECSIKLAAMSNREITKQAIAFSADWVLTGKVLSLAHTICSRAGLLLTDIIEVLKKESIGEYAIAGLPDISLRNDRVQGIFHHMSEVVKNVDGAAKEAVNDAKLITKWFSVSAIKDAIKKISLDGNKIYHILTPDTKKHAWHKVCVDYKNWESVKEIITKVMVEGDLVQKDAKIFEKTLTIGNEVVDVRFVCKKDGILPIGSAWVRT